MPTINIPPSIRSIFTTIEARLQKLETGRRFTAPATPVLANQPTITGSATGDPSVLRVGDIWLNTTSNTPKYVDTLGAVTSLASTPVPFGPRYVKTGYSYGPIVPATVTTSTLPSNNTLYAIPIYVPTNVTATSLSININALAGATGQYAYGLYSNSTTDDYPNAKLAETAAPTDTVFGATGWNVSVISVSLTPGLYWLAAVRQAATAPTMLCLTAGLTGDTPMPFGTTASLGTVPPIAWAQSGVTGTLPATFTATKTIQSGTVPLVVMGV